MITIIVGAVGLEGVAEFRCDMVPKDTQTAEYKNLMKERVENANKRSGSLMLIDPAELQRSRVMQAPTKVTF